MVTIQRGAPAASVEIVVPAHNEARRLPEGLALLCGKAAALPLRAQILVVDSASTDATSEVVRAWPAGPVPVRLLRCERAGKGLAVRTGLLATRAPFVGFCDADMATDLSALDVALDLLTAGSPMVIGSRALDASVVQVRASAARRVGAAVFRAMARRIVPDATDTQCGFKFFSGPLVREAALSLRTSGFVFDVELVARCLWLGATLTEIPVRWQDVAGSTFSVRRHSVGAFRDVAAIWVRSRGWGAPGPRAPAPAARAPVSPPGRPAAASRSHRYVTTTDLSGLRIAIANWRDPWHPQAGGAEQYAFQMARGLAASGARVRFLTARARGQARRERHAGIEITRAGGRFTVYPRVLGWLLAHRRSFDAVLDCQNGIPFFTPLVLPRRVPVLCVMHHVHTVQFGVHFPWWMAGVGRFLEGPAARLVYRWHACVAVSPSTVAAMRDRLGWTGDIYLIPNGAPEPGPAAQIPEPASAAQTPEPASAARTPEPAPIPQTRLVWVGRLAAHKRAELILPVAERLRGQGVVIDVVGRGPAARSLADRVAAAGLVGAVRLRGFLPEADKRAVVAGSALHLNTSLGEGWGLCVLEAAALGVPTVAYDVDGLRDAVRDGQTGWLVGEGEQLADVVERALKELSDPVRRADIAAACRRWAAQLTWPRSTERMAALIRAAVDSRTSRARHPGAWIVPGPDQGGPDQGGPAEGPVLDLLIAAGAVPLRPATPLERLLGHPTLAAPATGGAGRPP